MDYITLDNNYYFKVTKKISKDLTYIKDINDIDFRKVKKNNVFLLKIDFKTFNYSLYKKILKDLMHVKSLAVLNKIKLGISKESKIFIGYLINYDMNNQHHNDFIAAINAIMYKKRYERYNYIYDTVCDYLDSCFYGKNLCNFKENKCAEKKNTTSVTGCCRHYRKGPFSKLVVCEYLIQNYTCGAKCISCKLFTCDYLKKKGIEFKIKDILLLDVFLNPIQKYFIKYNVFTPKEKILKRIMLF